MSSSILFSLKIIFTVSLLNLLLGTLTGVYLSNNESKFIKILDAIISLPLVFPPIIMGFFLLQILGRNSFIGRSLYSAFDMTIIFSQWGVLLAAFVAGFPLMVKSVTASAAGIDKSILEASSLLGVNRLQLLYYIILPNISKGVLCGLTLSVARSFGEVGMTMVLGGNITGRTETLSLAIFNAVFDGNIPQATNLSLILGVTSITIFLIIQKQNEGGK